MLLSGIVVYVFTFALFHLNPFCYFIAGVPVVSLLACFLFVCYFLPVCLSVYWFVCVVVSLISVRFLFLCSFRSASFLDIVTFSVSFFLVRF